jgi:hypothetical protein
MRLETVAILFGIWMLVWPLAARAMPRLAEAHDVNVDLPNWGWTLSGMLWPLTVVAMLSAFYIGLLKKAFVRDAPHVAAELEEDSPAALPPDPENVARIELLSRRLNKRREGPIVHVELTQRFMLGERVREPHGEFGAIDTVYADLVAAEDARIVRPGWYEDLSIRPKTPKNGIWYGVILPAGACLVGEEDLEEAP